MVRKFVWLFTLNNVPPLNLSINIFVHVFKLVSNIESFCLFKTLGTKGQVSAYISWGFLFVRWWLDLDVKNVLARGGIEFIAVFLGIALSLWVDEYRENNEIQKLNDSILNRLYDNLESDSTNFTWVINAHKASLKSCNSINKCEINWSSKTTNEELKWGNKCKDTGIKSKLSFKPCLFGIRTRCVWGCLYRRRGFGQNKKSIKS